MPKSTTTKSQNTVFLCTYPSCAPDRGSRYSLDGYVFYGTPKSNNVDKHIIRKHFSTDKGQTFKEVSQAKIAYGQMEVENYLKTHRKECAKSVLKALTFGAQDDDIEESPPGSQNITPEQEAWLGTVTLETDSAPPQSSSTQMEDELYNALAAKVTALNITENAVEVDRNLTVQGTVTAQHYAQTSDERLKNNIENFPTQECANILKGLNPITYEFKSDPGKQELGFSAQKLEAASHHLVKEVDGYKRVNTYALTTVVAGAVINHEERIGKLETSNNNNAPAKRECPSDDTIMKSIYEALNNGATTVNEIRNAHNKAYNTKLTSTDFNTKIYGMRDKGLIKRVGESTPPKWAWA